VATGSQGKVGGDGVVCVQLTTLTRDCADAWEDAADERASTSMMIESLSCEGASLVVVVVGWCRVRLHSRPWQRCPFCWG